MNPNDPLKLIAHRGFADVFPENTVRAAGSSMQTVARSGTEGMVTADAIELDVLPTGDGEFVCFHDPMPGMLTDATGSTANSFVWNLPTGVVTSLRVLGSNETIPRLSSVLDALPSGTDVMLELKAHYEGSQGGGRAEWGPLVDDLLRVVDRYDHNIALYSGYKMAIESAQEIAPTYPRMYAFSTGFETGVEFASRTGCIAVTPPVSMLSSARGREAVLSAAHDAGMDVYPYTVRSWTQAHTARAAGADGILADSPSVALYGK